MYLKVNFSSLQNTSCFNTRNNSPHPTGTVRIAYIFFSFGFDHYIFDLNCESLWS